MKRRRSIGSRTVLLAIMLALGVLAGATPAMADDSSCPDGNVCFWTLQNFEGSKQVAGNRWEGQWVWVDGYHRNYHSLKNRFSNRAVLTAKPYQAIYCTPAGGKRETAPEFTVFFVGGAGSHC